MESSEPMPMSNMVPQASQAMVAMRDGVRLATDVYLPSPSAGQLPTVLVRTPYDKGSEFTFLPRLASVFNDHGYAFAAQDVRGRGRSEGDRRPLEFEVTDGYDTLDWITRQGWSDGTVGMFGDSYLGFACLAAAVSGHPALRAIVPRMIGTERAVDHDGVYSMELVEWAANYWMDNRNYARQVDWSVIPLSQVIERSTGRRCPPYERLRAITVAGYDAANLAFFGTADPRAAIRIPVLHWTGYWDLRAESCIADYLDMRHRPELTDSQFLILGATDHEFYPIGYDGPAAGLGEAPDAVAIEELLPAYTDAVAEFFDRHVRSIPGVDPPRVRWHLAHATWRSSDEWPPPGARPREIVLSPDDATSWLHDPVNPVPSLAPNPWSILSDHPDERAVESRADVLTFTGDELTSPLDLAGPVVVRLAINADAPSMHVVAKLVDVWPDGAARRLLLGARAVPADEYGATQEVRLGHLGYRFQPGHRIRIEIASSCYPFFELHPGTGEDPWTATQRRPVAVRLTSAGVRLQVTTVSGSAGSQPA
jgi:putative CocE/NonD family hydrolase